MLNIRQFRYGSDNLAYVVYGVQKAAVIDGGAWREILDFIDEKGLALDAVAVTHRHPDHMAGREELLSRFGALFVDRERLLEEEVLEIGDDRLQVFPTPGHSRDSVAFYTGNTLITGDTLFVGTVGNCFTGDYETFHQSLQKLIGFPPETMVYPGHDYVRYALNVAREIDSENPAIDDALQRYNPYHVFSTIGDEMRTNPFVRFDDPAIIEKIRSKGLPAESSYERFRSLMTMH